MLGNNKGFAPGMLIGIWVLSIALACCASIRHKKQRIEKQKTPEGRIEYPIKK